MCHFLPISTHYISRTGEEIIVRLLLDNLDIFLNAKDGNYKDSEI